MAKYSIIIELPESMEWRYSVSEVPRESSLRQPSPVDCITCNEKMTSSCSGRLARVLAGLCPILMT